MYSASAISAWPIDASDDLRHLAREQRRLRRSRSWPALTDIPAATAAFAVRLTRSSSRDELGRAQRRRVRLGVDLDAIDAGRRGRRHHLGVRVDEHRGADAVRLEARDDRRDDVVLARQLPAVVARDLAGLAPARA